MFGIISITQICARTQHTYIIHACRASYLQINKMLIYIYIQNLFMKSNRSHLTNFTKQGEGIGAQRKKRNECSLHKKMQVTLASPFYLNCITHLYFQPRRRSIYAWRTHFTNLRRHTSMENNIYAPMIVSAPPQSILLLISPSWPSWYITIYHSNSLSISKSSFITSFFILVLIPLINIFLNKLQVFGGEQLCGNVH